MALSTARIHRVRGRPPLLAAGIISLIHSHSSSVRSLGYIFSFIYPFYTTHEDFSDRLLEDGLTYFPLLDEISSCLRYRFQRLRDVIRGYTLCPKIQDHAFFIVPPIDPINEIITTSPQDMDRAHGARLLSAQGSIFLPFFAGRVSINIPFVSALDDLI